MNRLKSTKYLFPILGVFILLTFACSENDKYEVIPSEDVIPQAKGKYDYTEDQNIQDTIILSEFEQRLKDTLPNIQFTNDNELLLEKTQLMPNQLGFDEKNETYFTLDSIPYHFIEWTFTDSSKTVNALYNWLDCFGNDCRSIRIDEEKNGCKQAFIIWVSNTKISYLESPISLELKKWEALLIEKKGAWNFIIQQAPNRNIVWIESSTKDL